MPEEIMKSLQSLTSKDDSNPYTLNLQRGIDSLASNLEDVERDLSGFLETLEKEQAIYNEAKTTAPEFKNALKPLTKEQHIRFLKLIGSQYNLEEINVETDGLIAVFMEQKRNLLENYKEQIKALEVQRDSLSKEIIINQNKLNAQKELRDELLELMEKAKDPESTVTKAIVYSTLKKCIDEKGEIIFSEDDLDIAANMIMFPYNFPDLTAGKTSVSEIIKGAIESNGYYDPDLSSESVMDSPQIPLEPLPMPEATVVEKESNIESELEQIQTSDSNTAAIADRFGPWINGEEDPLDIDDLMAIADEERNGQEQQQSEIEVSEPVQESALDDPYDLIEALKEEEEKPIDNFNENVQNLRKWGLPGEPRKYPATLSQVSNEDIEKALELAKTYGVAIRTIGDVVKILSSNNVKEAFEKAIQTYGEDYPTAVKSATPSKLISVYKPYLGEKTYAVKQYISTPELIDALETVKEDVYDSSSYTAAVGLMGQLENLEHNNYALFVGDKAFPRTKILRNLERLMSLNPNNSNEELMLIALTYDPQLSALDVESIKEELHDKLGDVHGMRSAA